MNFQYRQQTLPLNCLKGVVAIFWNVFCLFSFLWGALVVVVLREKKMILEFPADLHSEAWITEIMGGIGYITLPELDSE